MFDGFAVTIPATDMDRARAFYADVLGLEGAENYPDGSMRFELDGTTMILYPSEFAGTNKATAAAFGTSEIEAAVAALRERGVEFHELEYGDSSTVSGIMEMPGGTRAAWFTDSEGNIIGVFENA